MRKEDWKSVKRDIMPRGGFFCINGIEICNDDCEEKVGRGSTCLVYHGHFCTGNLAGIRVIVKEFYPESQNVFMDIVRNEDGSLAVSETTKKTKEFSRRREQFLQGISNQKKLASSEAMEIAVKPKIVGEWGDSIYVVSEIHQGEELSKVRFSSLQEKLKAAVALTETVDILHDAGFLMLDMKPENLLWTARPSAVRIIDADSLIAYKEEAGFGERLFVNERYMAPEMEYLRKYAMESSEFEFSREKKRFLQPRTDIYTVGIYLFQMFFERIPEKGQMGENMNVLVFFEEFIEKYASEKKISKEKRKIIGRELLSVIKKMTMVTPSRRYQKAGEPMKRLNQIYFMASSDNMVPRKEIAKANADFAAYNLLQKYPLYEYGLKETENGKEISVAVFGNHVMRKAMISALISIGQMLDTELNIYLIAKDAKEFWESYTSKEQNESLKKAVVWTLNSKWISADIDTGLVARPLAGIHLVTEESESGLKKLWGKQKCNYFIFMEEDEERNQKLVDKLAALHKKKEATPFAAYIAEDGICPENITAFPISTFRFSETYNEYMFEEKIYQMGLLTHIYYLGYMDNDIEVDMEEVERNFRQNIYNIASSERCALHSTYKLASLGISRKKPGWILNYFRKISNPETLESLAWLEHISWTAYMLTSGACPVNTWAMDEYAYKGENDWKKKEDPLHLEHPFLVSSDVSVRLPESGWESMSEEQIRSLDFLDQTSWYIYNWYRKNKPVYREKFREYVKKYQGIIENEVEEPEKSEGLLLLRQLEDSGLRCIEGMCQKPMGQEMKKVTDCKAAIIKIQSWAQKHSLQSGLTLVNQIEERMRPVFDAYKDRDFKKCDRDLIWASLDLMG